MFNKALKGFQPINSIYKQLGGSIEKMSNTKIIPIVRGCCVIKRNKILYLLPIKNYLKLNSLKNKNIYKENKIDDIYV